VALQIREVDSAADVLQEWCFKMLGTSGSVYGLCLRGAGVVARNGNLDRSGRRTVISVSGIKAILSNHERIT
jgi:hypothetical protein